jgi:hypothetical protein
MGGVFYVVAGTTLYSVASEGSATALGTVLGDKKVQWADNGTQLVVMNPGTGTVPAPHAYVWDSGASTFTQITDADFIVSDSVCYLDGYFVFTASAGDVFFHSELNDPLSYDALAFGTADIRPDRIVSCHVSRNELYILGEYTVEVFQNVGGAGFVFQRIPGANFQVGTVSKYSAVEGAGAFFFLGGGQQHLAGVYMATGSGSARKVSSDAVDYQMQKYTPSELADAYAFGFSTRGHELICFSFRSTDVETPADIPNRTFAYNATASEAAGQPVWLELQSGATDNRWRVASVTKCYGKLLCTDTEDGRIGVLSDDVHTEYGAAIIREKVTAPLIGGGGPLFVSAIELVANAGQGTITGQGSDPQVMMDFSDDGARTWSSDLTRPLGKIGEYGRRTVWRRLGRCPRERVFRFRVSDPVRVDLIRLEVEVANG